MNPEDVTSEEQSSTDQEDDGLIDSNKYAM